MEAKELRERIEAERQRWVAEHGEADDALPRDQWELLPDEGHRGAFTESEVARAGEVFLDAEASRAFAREVYSIEDPGAGIFFPVEMLSALSLLSADAAERVRQLLGETEDEAAARVESFRERLARWRASGAPPDAFPGVKE